MNRIYIAVVIASGLAVAVGPAPARADVVPFTNVSGQVFTNGSGGDFFGNFNTSGAGPVSNSTSVGVGTGGSDGSHAAAAGAAFADFGTLGVQVQGDGIIPPDPTGRAGVLSAAFIGAQWDDGFTPVASPLSGLAPGASVTRQPAPGPALLQCDFRCERRRKPGL